MDLLDFSFFFIRVAIAAAIAFLLIVIAQKTTRYMRMVDTAVAEGKPVPAFPRGFVVASGVGMAILLAAMSLSFTHNPRRDLSTNVPSSALREAQELEWRNATPRTIVTPKTSAPAVRTEAEAEADGKAAAQAVKDAFQDLPDAAE